MMKKSLVLALVLSALLLVTVMAVSVSADPSLTIPQDGVAVTIDKPNNLVTFEVTYSAVEVDQITVLAVKGPAGDSAPAATEANIVYFNQQGSAVSNKFTFSVPYSEFTEGLPYCWIKVGGTAIATAQNAGGNPIWSNDVPALVYGDVNNDKAIDSSDAILIIKYAGAMDSGADLDETEFPDNNFPVGSTVPADVNDDKAIDSSDAILIIKYAGAMDSGADLDETEFPGGKFPADN